MCRLMCFEPGRILCGSEVNSFRSKSPVFSVITLIWVEPTGSQNSEAPIIVFDSRPALRTIEGSRLNEIAVDFGFQAFIDHKARHS